MCVYTSLCLVFGLRSSVFGRYPVLWLECTVAWWAPSTSLNTVAYLFIIILFGEEKLLVSQNKDITKCLIFNITRKSHSQHKLYKIFIFHNSLSISLTDSSVRVSVTIYGERSLSCPFVLCSPYLVYIVVIAGDFLRMGLCGALVCVCEY